MKMYLLAAMLIAAIPRPVMAQSQADSVWYVDPNRQFKVVIPPQEVAGLDVKILACHAHLRKGSHPQHHDTTFVQFFVPDGYPLAIEMRQAEYLYEIKPDAKGWSTNFFQCLGLPNAILQRMQLQVGELLVVGKGHQDWRGVQRITPVAWNANAPDSVSNYEFKLMPNRDLEASYSILREIQPDLRPDTVLTSPKRFYPGKAPFTIKWDGRIGQKLAPEGTYKLVLSGIIFLESGGEIDGFRSYSFYHKPIFKSCTKE